MRSITYKVPAKINLYLRLTGKRKDGFNNLCSVFQKIALFDDLKLERAERGFSIKTEGFSPCCVKDNLVYKAYQLIKKKTRFRGGLKVLLNKQIPAGSGLGGASADAACTLLGINELYDLQLDIEALVEMGRKIGSDVPFFIYPFNMALGIERGDMLVDLPNKVQYWLLLVTFDNGLATKDVFHKFSYPNGFRINLTKICREVIMLTQFFRERDISSLANGLKNDLSFPAFLMKPEIKEVLNILKKQNKASGMTGSGPTVFSLFKRKKDALLAQKELFPYSGIKVIMCRTLV